jgi:hypothetical protein
MDFAEAPTVSTQARLVELRSGIQIIDPVYRPFDLLVGPSYRQTVEQEIVSYGYKIDDIEDAYPSSPSVAGMVSLAAGNPLVRPSETVPVVWTLNHSFRAILPSIAIVLRPTSILKSWKLLGDFYSNGMKSSAACLLSHLHPTMTSFKSY